MPINYPSMVKKLPKAPLQEVIFEVRWALDLNPETRHFQDNGYDLAVGKFAGYIEDQFPIEVKKIPDEFMGYLPHQPVHQFWSAERTWPVVQLGPGIMTLNDTDKNYIWEDTFYPCLKEVLNQLSRAYAKNKTLNFMTYTLRYIDVVKIADYDFENWPSFIQKNLNFTFENQFDARGLLTQFNFQQTFEQEDGSGLKISLANGKNHKQEPVFIWQIEMTQTKKVDLNALLEWVETSHKITSQAFHDVCKMEFYDSFNQ